METATSPTNLLDEIRILDLTDEKASFCTKLLADMGATVIKIERPGGDPSRKIGPFAKNTSEPKSSLSFSYNNANKFGVTLNLEHSTGRKIFLSLAKRFDVIVETFPPGRLEELNLGFNVLSKINPGLILASVTGFGQNGPHCHYKSCDIVASAFGGQMFCSGSPSLPPLKPYGEQPYYAASLFAAIGILIARHKQTQCGQGAHIDISLQEAVVSTLSHQMVRYFHEKIISTRQGNLHWDNLFCILPCKDGFIQLTLLHQWETLVEWMDNEGMAEDLMDNKWSSEAYRYEHIDHIIEVLQKWTQKHTVNRLFELGQLMHFPWSPVFSPKEVLECHQHKSRKFFIDIQHPEIGKVLKYPRLPYRFSSGSLTYRKKAPLAGEDNYKIYNLELGMTKNELNRLSKANVI